MASDLQVRPFRASDEEAVLELWTACHLIVAHNDPRKDIRRKLQVNPEWFLIGEWENQIVATCMVGYEGHRGWINYLAVSPGRRRRGIAARLITEAERLLRQADCPKINLQIRSTNLPVIEFYERLGFKIDHDVSMGKKLEIDGADPSVVAL